MASDHCKGNAGTFKVLVENIFCGAEGFTCAKGLKLEFQGTVILAMKGAEPLISNLPNAVQVPVKIERCGMYLKFSAYGKCVQQQDFPKRKPCHMHNC